MVDVWGGVLREDNVTEYGRDVVYGTPREILYIVSVRSLFSTELTGGCILLQNPEGHSASGTT